MRNKIIWLILVIAAMFAGCRKGVTPHSCGFNLCPFKGQIAFVGHSDCEVGSDCEAIDAVHFKLPSLTYDECETYLFNTVK